MKYGARSGEGLPEAAVCPPESDLWTEDNSERSVTQKNGEM